MRDVIGLNIGPLENAQGSFDSNLFGGRIEIGRNYPVGPVILTPFAALQFDRLHTSSYSETSTVTGASTAGVLGLQYDAHTVASVPLYLGGQVDSRFDVAPGVALIPSLRVAEVHEFNAQRTITAEFLSAPGFPLLVHGAAAAEDAAQVQAGLKLALDRRISVYANFTGYFSGGGNSLGGFGGVKISW
jgi:outer membrane autotransporter protein